MPQSNPSPEYRDDRSPVSDGRSTECPAVLTESGLIGHLRRWFPDATSLWRHRNFVRLWGAETVSQFGTQMSIVALPLVAVLALGASPAEMGYLTAAGTIPFLLIGLFVGVWVDRLSRRRLMIAADLFRAGLLLIIPAAWVMDVLRIEMLYAVALLAGAFTVVFDVSQTAFVPSVVRRDQFIDANSKLRASMSIAQIGGPGLGGVLVGLITAPFAILLDAVSFLISAILVRNIDVREAEPRAERSAGAVRREISEGLKLIFGDRVLRAIVLSAGMTSGFGYAFLAVYIIYMTEDLGLGPAAVGLVFAIGGAGALLGAVVAGPLSRRLGIGRAIVVSRFVVGIGGIPVPLAVLVPSIALPMVLLSEFVQWMMIVAAAVNEVSVRQSITPDRLLGRVNATYFTVTQGLIPFGALLGGFVGEFANVKVALVTGIAGMLLAFLFVLLSPLRDARFRIES